MTSGIAITKDGHSGDASFDRIEIHEASHPIPDQRGVEATQRAIEIVESADRDAVVLCLISGGGSALFEAPRPPVTLDDLAEVTRLMLRAGATIDELNQVRRPLSLVKGGGFLNAIGSRTVVTLILSDVLGNDLSTIASGPTVPSHDSPGAALARLDQFGLKDKVPESVMTVLSSEQEGRRTRPELFLSAVVADNRDAIHGAGPRSKATDSRKKRWIDVEGEAREMGRLWADECSRCSGTIDALVGGGE
ncbi:MAG: glycerate-2-kinase family protein [Thermomicrobiales bacterium]